MGLPTKMALLVVVKCIRIVISFGLKLKVILAKMALSTGLVQVMDIKNLVGAVRF